MRTVSIGKGRLEAFSDGVIAIIITIMVLEIKTPVGHELKDLKQVAPVFLNYVLSFIYVGIYWNNHHHMFHVVKGINGAVLWANLHLLFWLSVIPFVTDWMGESNFSHPWPVALYGVVLLMNAIAYTILTIVLVRHEGENSTLAIALGEDWKGKVSLVCYCVAIALACVDYSRISFTLYILVACIWFIPDRRIEKTIAEENIHKTNGNVR
ncbi:MAG: TMEM175 family protein [Mucilaginibacter sp.]